MTDRDRLNPPSPGLDVPPPDSITQEMRTRAWSRAVRDGETAVWPMLAIAIAIIVVFVILVNTIGDTPNTQVGENAGRPAVTTQPPVTSPPVPQ